MNRRIRNRIETRAYPFKVVTILAAAALFVSAEGAPKAAPPPPSPAAKAVAGPMQPAMASQTGTPAQPAEVKDPEAEKREQERQNTVLAEVNGKKITVGDFEAAAYRRGPFMMQDLSTPDGLKNMLQDLIKEKLLAEEAARKGYDKDSEALRVKKNQMAMLLERRIVGEASSSPIDEAELRQYYDGNIDRYRQAPKVRARVIVLKDKGQAQEMLKKLLADKPSQNEFKQLAQENSQDEATRLKGGGGDLGFVARPGDRREGDPEVDPALVDAAFSLKEDGEVFAKPIQTPTGYNILMRTGYRPLVEVTFEEAKASIEPLVAREKRRKVLEEKTKEFQDKGNVTYFDENLKLIKVDMSAGLPGREDRVRRPITINRKGGGGPKH